MAKEFVVAVVGATGMVGKEMLRVLEQRNFPVKEVKLLASHRSAGGELPFRGQNIKIEELKKDSFKDVQIGLFSAGGSISQEFAPAAGKAGCVVVDNTSAFRMDPDVPLVVPEVNPDDIAQYTKKMIIANPNCSTIQMVVVLSPIHKVAKIKRVVVSTYQATSGAGKEAVDEMEKQTHAIFGKKPLEVKVFAHQIAFNCLPHIDVFLPDGYTKEEVKMIKETNKIMGDDSIKVTATCVRVPVFNGHSESVNIELEKDLSPEEIRDILSQAPGVKVVDDPSQKAYPLAINASGKDDTYVGRIRRDSSVEHGINMWIVSDNLRKGAALNAVQIAEILGQKYL